MCVESRLESTRYRALESGCRTNTNDSGFEGSESVAAGSPSTSVSLAGSNGVT